MYFLIFLLTFAGVLLFYPYTIYFTGDINRYFIMIDLFIVDIFFKKNRKKTLLRIKILGIFNIYEKKIGKNRIKKYNPDYDRIYFVISFFTRHILSIFRIIDIKKLGVEIKVGFFEYYLLSQIHMFSILLNNILPDGFFCIISPDFEKELLEYEGRGEITVFIWKILWFVLKLFIHPATWSGLYEYYRYSRSIEK